MLNDRLDRLGRMIREQLPPPQAHRTDHREHRMHQGYENMVGHRDGDGRQAHQERSPDLRIEDRSGAMKCLLTSKQERT